MKIFFNLSKIETRETRYNFLSKTILNFEDLSIFPTAYGVHAQKKIIVKSINLSLPSEPRTVKFANHCKINKLIHNIISTENYFSEIMIIYYLYPHLFLSIHLFIQ